MPEGISIIGDGAFSGCSSLIDVYIPESTRSIGGAAFKGCESLTKIRIPEGIYWLEETFSGCSSLMEIELPNSMLDIGEYTFKNCKSLQKIKLPLKVRSIGRAAFSGCENLLSIELPDKGEYASGVRIIEESAFAECGNLNSITIPQTVDYIYSRAFANCMSLKRIIYKGTRAQWEKIEIDEMDGGNNCLKNATIYCTDSVFLPTTENSITGDTSATENGSYQATFSGVEAGKDYVIIVSRSGSDPLSADNLLYINQITADADGELTVPFRTAADAAEMTYVVACAQDDATVEPGQPDKPNQPDQPDKPGEDEPSSGGDGGGAIILIGGVAAVAAVAGVVLLMPVKVEGTVKLADQPVANATVQVLKNGNVAAQTVTDANGHFTVKVKRGGYTLRVQWTDASGQPVMRTVDFKAPNANLNVAA